jgi:hypothetical protein
MADDSANQGKPNISVRLPIGGLATLALLGIAAAGYLIATRDSEPEPQSVAEKALASGRNARRRIGLKTVIALLENDASRKVVLAVLRAMARRA